MRQRVQARRRGAERGERGGKGEEGVIKGLHQLRVGGIHAIDVSLHLGTRGFLLRLKPGGSSSHEDERVPGLRADEEKVVIRYTASDIIYE